ncbi:MAG: CapA family protein [Gammaproteobacteria bacterium]|nr:CapA family protein [Gammaproteobacteria bacterium]NIR83487.1 CapA family protein [Gammaproteobacteria bacterium]NIR91409.1 CapA family protein [Gammaproteobacteria bacterium]NIU04649.1 CapA family protein [Gammaproteobacteria bacterium]NIV51691.1 poly-gamma-glutamate biosynthesis protein [Gammaproteobacteria bacterium]
MPEDEKRTDVVTLFLCGDVMTGRGIDQILRHPSGPGLYEPYVRDARRYVDIAEQINGPIDYPVDFDYIWGDALPELERVAPDVRIVNLETAVTASEGHWPGKGIHYRMHPANVPCLAAAGLDCCSLANNHTLDWGYAGLEETLSVLHGADIFTAGAGRNRREAQAPAVLDAGRGRRVLVFGLGSATSGIPASWAASGERPGVNLLPDLSPQTARGVGAQMRKLRRPADIVVASVHWGENWGYEIPDTQRRFAHALIDAGADIVHGHSSHHVKGIEVYGGKLILYGCGDFLTDYEGIEGYEHYRDDLGLMYFATIDVASGSLRTLHMTPTRIERFRLHRARPEEVRWLRAVLDREGKALGTRAVPAEGGTLKLQWA